MIIRQPERMFHLTFEIQKRSNWSFSRRYNNTVWSSGSRDDMPPLTVPPALAATTTYWVLLMVFSPWPHFITLSWRVLQNM